MIVRGEEEKEKSVWLLQQHMRPTGRVGGTENKDSKKEIDQ
jgi:hypothetical protein